VGPHIFDTVTDWHDALSSISDMDYIASSGMDLSHGFHVDKDGEYAPSTSSTSEHVPASHLAKPTAQLSSPTCECRVSVNVCCIKLLNVDKGTGSGESYLEAIFFNGCWSRVRTRHLAGHGLMLHGRINCVSNPSLRLIVSVSLD
jgi:hypothetical protein